GEGIMIQIDPNDIVYYEGYEEDKFFVGKILLGDRYEGIHAISSLFQADDYVRQWKHAVAFYTTNAKRACLISGIVANAENSISIHYYGLNPPRRENGAEDLEADVILTEGHFLWKMEHSKRNSTEDASLVETIFENLPDLYGAIDSNLRGTSQFPMHNFSTHVSRIGYLK
ncbi:MAG: hypothetical protein AAGJ85_05725, partial [Pseudomonadota bacterium]